MLLFFFHSLIRFQWERTTDLGECEVARRWPVAVAEFGRRRDAQVGQQIGGAGTGGG